MNLNFFLLDVQTLFIARYLICCLYITHLCSLSFLIWGVTEGIFRGPWHFKI